MSSRQNDDVTQEDFFLTASTDLHPGDAVAALIVLEDGRYLLQLRDQKPDIFYPGHWGLFGGSVDDGEEPEEALYRELEEELGLVRAESIFFANFVFDLSPIGVGSFYRKCYEVPLTYAEHSRLELREGAAMKIFDGKEIMRLNRLVPYDAFTLWLHHERNRLKRRI
jgi:8-oxo-dGTP pyrophosphatase MutT (NUDIX family)